jgi:hypothetical protein
MEFVITLLCDILWAVSFFRNQPINHPTCTVYFNPRPETCFCVLHKVVNTVTSNQDCVANIAESLVLSNLLVLLHSLPSSKTTEHLLHLLVCSTSYIHFIQKPPV